MTTRYREQKDIILKPEFAGKNLLPVAESFDKAGFDKLLSQPGCTGLRIYYGMTEEQQLRMIIVGVNEKNSDLLPADFAAADGSLVENGVVCPPICAPASPLNP